MDIFGPFPPAKQQKFLLVAIDHFSKWIEAEPVAVISAAVVRKFTWKNIVTRFGIPHTIITHNGKQFTDKGFNEFLSQLKIRYSVTSVEHPQTNGQAEAANKIILTELKKRLGQAKGKWAEELLEVLWVDRCAPQSTTGETPFRLVYGTDAMIPVEVGEPSFRRQQFDVDDNTEAMRVDLNIVEEIREKALVNTEACRQRVERRFNSKVKPRSFKQGDLVLRATKEARKDPREGKLAANWEGPFRVIENLMNGAYRLEELNGRQVPRTWNSTHLKFYFS